MLPRTKPQAQQTQLFQNQVTVKKNANVGDSKQSVRDNGGKIASLSIRIDNDIANASCVYRLKNLPVRGALRKFS